MFTTCFSPRGYAFRIAILLALVVCNRPSGAQEFERIANENSNFHYVPTLSRCGDRWQGCQGYVQDHVREIVAGRSDLQAYICGLHQMVDANRKLLKEEMGWDRKQIVFERYD